MAAGQRVACGSRSSGRCRHRVQIGRCWQPPAGARAGVTGPGPGCRRGDWPGLLRPVGSDRGALPGLLLVGFPGPPAAPGVRLSPHQALRVSCPLGLAGCRDRLGCPRGRYAAAAVAVAGDRHG